MRGIWISGLLRMPTAKVIAPSRVVRGIRGVLYRLISTSSTHALIAAETKVNRIPASSQ
jgi:hypothetical protein